MMTIDLERLEKEEAEILKKENQLKELQLLKDEISKKIEAIKLTSVYCAYHGRTEGCRCGCNGFYYYAKDYENERPSYYKDDEGINDRMVKKIYNIILKNKNNVEITENEDAEEIVVNFDNNNKPYTIYAKK